MTIKLRTTTEGGKAKAKAKIQKNLQNKSKKRIINVFVQSLLSEFFPLLGITVHLRITSNTVLVSGPAVGAAQILIWSYSYVFLASNVQSYQN